MASTYSYPQGYTAQEAPPLAVNPLESPPTPLTPQEWQGLVASGALPVRQALHSFIAASCEKPPETKEEARAILEVMFQIRASKIRRAMEEGKLSTAEALKHKVIQRRESVAEGTLKNSRREKLPSRTMSAPPEHKPVFQVNESSNSGNIQGQPWVRSQLTDEPSMIAGDTTLLQGLQGGITDMTSMDTDLFGEQASTFGLSDDDLMSSFTTFTAKLGDSFLIKPNSAASYAPTLGNVPEYDDHIGPHGQLSTRLQSCAPSMTSPTMGSPTASNESQSPSPWMPWMSPEQGLLARSQGPKSAVEIQPQTQYSVVPLVLHQGYPGVQQLFPVSTEQQVVGSHFDYQQGGLFAPSAEASNTRGKQQQQQSDTWNQYMQYLFYQQALDLQSSDPSVVPRQHYSQQPQMSPPDPHWQATMMTMMIAQNPTLKNGIDRRSWTTNNDQTFSSGIGYQDQHQPSL
ncbi:hypothetical protein BGZ65_001990 [Modicella reniformis]|uniref:Uncharacterized protein n=1 Tax=Modicella reniformis TaxID=1440133 RepID=A0A9P6ILC6_9FUNG|nr:hypothetical protein BGZ65_001990 [Modicella reniformis]